MKYLGIDFGSKRVGLSLSDDSGKMAFPHSVISNDKNLLTEIKKIIKDEDIDEVVIGESKDFKGEPNKIMKAITEFKITLENLPAQSGKAKLKIWLEPEFMTSVQAERSIESRRTDTHNQRSKKQKEIKKEMLDASAATIILQTYLDKN